MNNNMWTKQLLVLDIIQFKIGRKKNSFEAKRKNSKNYLLAI